MQPFPKDGLVVWPPHAVEPIDVVAPEAAEVRAMTRDIREAFNRAERQVADRYGHPVRPRSREGMEPGVEAAYRFGTTYYIEAVRPYRALGQAAGDCNAVAFGTGWFVHENNRPKSVAFLVDLLPCDRNGASYMLPLGVVRIDGKVFWLAQFSSWVAERFVVLELKPKSVDLRLNVFGGGCA